MTLALRRTVFADGERRSDDYEVRHNGRTVGRILLRSTGRELWQWTRIGWGPSHGPNGGVANSLAEAKAAFRAASGSVRYREKERTRYPRPEHAS